MSFCLYEKVSFSEFSNLFLNIEMCNTDAPFSVADGNIGYFWKEAANRRLGLSRIDAFPGTSSLLQYNGRKWCRIHQTVNSILSLFTHIRTSIHTGIFVIYYVLCSICYRYHLVWQKCEVKTYFSSFNIYNTCTYIKNGPK